MEVETHSFPHKTHQATAESPKASHPPAAPHDGITAEISAI